MALALMADPKPRDPGLELVAETVVAIDDRLGEVRVAHFASGRVMLVLHTSKCSIHQHFTAEQAKLIGLALAR